MWYAKMAKHIAEKGKGNVYIKDIGTKIKAKAEEGELYLIYKMLPIIYKNTVINKLKEYGYDVEINGEGYICFVPYGHYIDILISWE